MKNLPKLTFFNLPENKRETLINAAKKEFSRVPLYDASIANIVKAADIPRGSFYQYFEDKEDAYFYLLNELAKKEKGQFVSRLHHNEGDIFQTVIDYFQWVLKEEDHLQFMKNALLNMTHKIENTFARIFSDNEMNKNFQEFSSLINKNNLNITNDQELFHVMQIIKAVTFRNLIDKFARDWTNEAAINYFTIEINLLKKGLVRQPALDENTSHKDT